jgi:hypothetical protein
MKITALRVGLAMVWNVVTVMIFLALLPFVGQLFLLAAAVWLILSYVGAFGIMAYKGKQNA